MEQKLQSPRLNKFVAQDIEWLSNKRNDPKNDDTSAKKQFDHEPDFNELLNGHKSEYRKFLESYNA